MAAITQRNYSDLAPPTTLTANIGTTDVSLPVVSTAQYPTPPFTIGLARGTPSQEVCLCDAITDVTHFHVVRGYDGTARVSHSANDTVEHCTTSLDFTEANLHHSDSTRDDHGQYMDVAGVRHDVAARHQLGTTIPVGTPAPMTLGQAGVIGATGSGADAGHKHAFPSAQAIADALIPVSTVWAMAGNLPTVGGVKMAPPGWIYCDGRTLPRGVFPILYSSIGTLYGAGDGSTTFNVPNYQCRFLIGVNPTYSNSYLNNHYNLGFMGGEEAHAMSGGEMASHAHGIYDPGHIHSQPGGNGFIIGMSSSTIGIAKDPADIYPGWTVSVVGSTTLSTTGIGIFSAGSSVPHQNMPWYASVYYIMKADTYVPGYG